MKSYLGTKIIKAEEMDYVDFCNTHRQGSFETELKHQEGYHVVYPNPDNTLYHSWSPKDVFEIAYRGLTLEEISMISND